MRAIRECARSCPNREARAVAGPTAAPQATLVPRETPMNFLEAHYVAPTSGQSGVEPAKASVVQVICVKK